MSQLFSGMFCVHTRMGLGWTSFMQGGMLPWIGDVLTMREQQGRVELCSGMSSKSAQNLQVRTRKCNDVGNFVVDACFLLMTKNCRIKWALVQTTLQFICWKFNAAGHKQFKSLLEHIESKSLTDIKKFGVRDAFMGFSYHWNGGLTVVCLVSKSLQTFSCWRVKIQHSELLLGNILDSSFARNFEVVFQFLFQNFPVAKEFHAVSRSYTFQWHLTSVFSFWGIIYLLKSDLPFSR